MKLKLFSQVLWAYKGLGIHFSSLLDRIEAISHMRSYRLDFDDELALQAMKKNRIEKMSSYDRIFDKVLSIRRVQPEDLL